MYTCTHVHIEIYMYMNSVLVSFYIWLIHLQTSFNQKNYILVYSSREREGPSRNEKLYLCVMSQTKQTTALLYFVLNYCIILSEVNQSDYCLYFNLNFSGFKPVCNSFRQGRGGEITLKFK